MIGARGLYTTRSFGAGLSHAYVVNGLDVPYDVLVNGDRISVPAGGRRKLSVGFGEVVVEPVPGDYSFEPATAEVDVSLFERLGDDSTLIFNPDRSALFVIETAYYSSNPSLADPGKYEAHFGEASYVFEDVDYHFTETPEQIEVSSTPRNVERRALIHQNERSPGDRLAQVAALSLAYQQVLFLVRDGREREADRLIAGFLMQMRDHGLDRDEVESVGSMRAVARAEAHLDRKAYAKAAAASPDPLTRFGGALLDGDLDGAAEILGSGVAEAGAAEHLLLHAIAAYRDHPELAARHRGLALALLDAGSVDEKRLASWMRGEEEPPLRAACEVYPTPDKRPIALAVLGVQGTERRRELLEAALQHSYRNGLVKMLLVSILEREEEG